MILTHCPFCTATLTDIWISVSRRGCLKECNKNANHFYQCQIYKDNVIMFNIRVDKLQRLYAYWLPTAKIFSINEKSECGNRIDTKFFLPWFEPDLSDYDKLLKKIKSYIVFS